MADLPTIYDHISVKEYPISLKLISSSVSDPKTRIFEASRDFLVSELSCAPDPTKRGDWLITVIFREKPTFVDGGKISSKIVPTGAKFASVEMLRMPEKCLVIVTFT